EMNYSVTTAQRYANLTRVVKTVRQGGDGGCVIEHIYNCSISNEECFPRKPPYGAMGFVSFNLGKDVPQKEAHVQLLCGMTVEVCHTADAVLPFTGRCND